MVDDILKPDGKFEGGDPAELAFRRYQIALKARRAAKTEQWKRQADECLELAARKARTRVPGSDLTD